MICGVVKYWNLGRSKAGGTLIVNVKNEDEFNALLYNSFSKHLLSRNISFDKGKIYAGGRLVGEFMFTATKDEEQTKSRYVRFSGNLPRETRKTARWGKDTPLSETTQNELIKQLSERYGEDKVRRTVLCMPVSVEKVIDNEEDGQETLKRLKQEPKLI